MTKAIEQWNAGIMTKDEFMERLKEFQKDYWIVVPQGVVSIVRMIPEDWRVL